MDAPLVPWALTRYGFVVYVVGITISAIGFWRRSSPNRVADLGMGISVVGLVLMILPLVVNAALFMLHAVADMAVVAYRAMYPHL